jgi:Tat protein translocase TatC
MWKALATKLFKAREKFALNLSKPDEEKPFLDHLEDLRKMIVRIALTLLICTFCTFYFYNHLIDILKQPLWWTGAVKSEAEMNAMLQVLRPQDGFLMAMNVSLVAAIILSSPFLLYFLLQFILPGLHEKEKKMLLPAIAIGSGLFMGGVLFSYYIVLPGALKFFYQFNAQMGFANQWRVDEYVKFATRFVLLFGAAFELPVVVMALVKLDILGFKIMNSTRSYAVIAIAVFSAIITPTPDPFTMLIMAGPLYVMYEICIWLAYFMEKKDRQLYPEYYKEIEKDELALAAEENSTAAWDKEDYNPWSSADDEDDDEAIKPKPAAGTVSRDGTETPAPKEKSLEESSQEDEQRPYKNED